MRKMPLVTLLLMSACFRLDLSGFDFAVGADTATAELVADEEARYSVRVDVQVEDGLAVNEAFLQLTGNTDEVITADATLQLLDGDEVLFEGTLDADGALFTEQPIVLDCEEGLCSTELEVVAALGGGEALTVDLGALVVAASEADDDGTLVTVLLEAL